MTEQSATVRIACIQMCSTPHVPDNLATARSLIKEAAGAGARIVALPEFFPIISNDIEEKIAAGEPLSRGASPAPSRAPIQHFLHEVAREYDIYLVAGTIPIRAGRAAKVYNSCLVFNPEGRRIARYDKIHLFHFRARDIVIDESSFLLSGKKIVTVDTAYGRWGLSICFDLRFPEMYRRMSVPLPVQIIFAPSAFTPTTGRAHWELLCRARAVENFAYLIAPAQAGQHTPSRRSYGHSLIIDPWGGILAEAKDDQPAVLVADIDLAARDRLLAKIPIDTSRRFR